jgi:SHS family lactate transporter-like MFS transporter
MGGVLQGLMGLGFMLSTAIYGLFYSYIGWRGMRWVGVLPVLSVFYVGKFVKESPVWLENRRRQRVEQRDVRAPLLSIFKPDVLANTLTACVRMAGGFVAYYSVNETTHRGMETRNCRQSCSLSGKILPNLDVRVRSV